MILEQYEINIESGKVKKTDVDNPRKKEIVEMERIFDIKLSITNSIKLDVLS